MLEPYATKSFFRGVNEIKEVFLGENPKISSKFSNSINSIISNLFSQAINFIKNHCKALKDSDSNKVTVSFIQICGDLHCIIKKSKEMIEKGEKEGYKILKDLLLFKAQIDVSDFKEKLDRKTTFVYEYFSKQLNELQETAKKNAGNHLLGSEDFNKDDIELFDDTTKKECYDLYRWAHSTENQRKLAALTSTHMLPFKAKEVPAGAVLLTNVSLRANYIKLKGHNLRFNQRLKFISAIFVSLFIGKSVVHSEIALGDGKFLHQDDAKTKGCSGLTEIEDRGNSNKHLDDPVIITHDVVIPRSEKMFNGCDRKKSLKDCISKIKDISGKIKVRTSPLDIVKCGVKHFFSKRKTVVESENFLSDSNSQSDAEGYIKKGLSCSATVAAVYKTQGVEVGRYIGKTVEEINPADYTRSGMFTPIFESGTFTYEDPV